MCGDSKCRRSPSAALGAATALRRVGSGSYAGYYTFTLAESADVTITAESSVDTYLFLRDGSERDGAELCSNDDHGSDVNGDLCQSIESTLGSEYDSGLAASLGAGSYIIEVTTYDAAETGEFTLTISGLPTDVSPTPTPEHHSHRPTPRSINRRLHLLRTPHQSLRTSA